MGKTIKNVTLEDLEEMGIDIKAILKDKLKKKKKRRSKKNKPLKKVDDKSFFPKAYNANNTGFNGSNSFAGPPILSAKIDPNVSNNNVKEVENSLTAKINNVTNQLTTDKQLLGNYLNKQNKVIDYLYNKSKNNDLVVNNINSVNRYGNPVIESLFNRFDAIENNSANNYLVNVQSTNFSRDEIPEEDYVNQDDGVGGINEKEVEFESNYEDEALKLDELNTDKQINEDVNPIDEPVNEEPLMDTSQVDNEINTKAEDVKRVREYANGKGGPFLTSDQRIVLENMLNDNAFTTKQLARINKYKQQVYIDDEDEENVEVVKSKPKKSSTKLKDAVKNAKSPDEFKSPKNSKK